MKTILFLDVRNLISGVEHLRHLRQASVWALEWLLQQLPESYVHGGEEHQKTCHWPFGRPQGQFPGSSWLLQK